MLNKEMERALREDAKKLEALTGRIHDERILNPAAVALGKLGGASKSRKKVAAARKNGKLGGRPRKKLARRGGPDV